MPEQQRRLRRSHQCGELNENDIGNRVVVQGWVNRLRDHGGVIFVDLRDRGGILQIVFNPETSPDMSQALKALRAEFVVAVEGDIALRPEGTYNENMPTGKIEMNARTLEIINVAQPPVFPIEDDAEIDEALRLKYRYLDLRRPIVQSRLMRRHRAIKYIRDHLDARGFIEVETPMLTKSTPEGARDYLVPSRLNPGCFYALPQSPQLFKQLLMVGGLERYYQIARCFRDEDLRADRQPEFTQLDLEMSFVEERDVMGLMEALILGLFRDIGAVAVPASVPVMTYREAMDRFGVDNPDLRFGLELFDGSSLGRECSFQVFKKAVADGGVVKGLNLPDGAALSRKELDDLTAKAAEWGAKGLAWLKYQDGAWQGPAAKFLNSGELETLAALSSAGPGSCLFFAAGKTASANQILGRLRLHLARERGLIPEGRYCFVWITEFPLLEWDDEEKRYVSVHHPFTSPNADDLSLLETDPLRVRARAYDLVLNGSEIGGGSIRIHQPELQRRVFDRIGIGPEEAESRFGFLLEAFRFGAPPHGGIAMGLDRIMAILTGADSIREVIAFPKTQKATCLMTGAPDRVSLKQLRELHVRSTAMAREPEGSG